MARQYPDLPHTKEILPELLPWAVTRKNYTGNEAQAFCTAQFEITGEALVLRFPSRKHVWSNHVAFALKEMTEKKLHTMHEEDRYEANVGAILSYLSDHGWNPSEIDEQLAIFIDRTRSMPRITEAERLTIQRIGQEIFRAALMEMWDCRCPVTGIDAPPLLRASHIKSWASCDNDAERLDVNNGLLLAAHIDAAFDAGLISFDRRGRIQFSPELTSENKQRLGIQAEIRIPLPPAHNRYMSWHRTKFGFPEAV